MSRSSLSGSGWLLPLFQSRPIPHTPSPGSSFPLGFEELSRIWPETLKDVCLSHDVLPGFPFPLSQLFLEFYS